MKEGLLDLKDISDGHSRIILSKALTSSYKVDANMSSEFSLTKTAEMFSTSDSMQQNTLVRSFVVH